MKSIEVQEVVAPPQHILKILHAEKEPYETQMPNLAPIE